MILLDTNVISEPMRPVPEQKVVQWIDAQSLDTLYLSSVTVAELRAGVSILPDGKRKQALGSALENTVLPMFSGRVLPLDESTTKFYADIIALTKSRGVGISLADALIASIALERGYIIASRDVDPFEAVNAKVIDPWRL